MSAWAKRYYRQCSELKKVEERKEGRKEGKKEKERKIEWGRAGVLFSMTNSGYCFEISLKDSRFRSYMAAVKNNYFPFLFYRPSIWPEK